MKNDFYVYLIADNTVTPCYIGKGRGNRASVKRRKNPKINALIAFGGTLPPVKVREGLTEAEAYECERALIAFHGRQCDGGTLLNVCTGGAGVPGYTPSAEHRAKLSAAKIGRKLSPEHIAKRTATRLANGNGNYWGARNGRIESPESRAKVSAAQKGKLHSPESIAKRVATRLTNGNYRCPNEQRAKIAAALKGRKQPPESIAKREATRAAKRLAKLNIETTAAKAA